MTAPFSVLLPVYAGDSPEHFRRAFDSLAREQTLLPDQIVVVQDGPVSPEMTNVLNTTFAGSPVPTALVVLEQNVGLGHALETGLVACAHDIVARMDADDVSEPERFARQLPLFDEGYDIVGSAIREFSQDDDGDLMLVDRIPPLEHEGIRRYARVHSPFNHPTVVYRKSRVSAAGGYQEIPLLEDYWLFARMLLEGARAVNLAEPLVRYRISSGSYERRGGLRLLRSELRLQSAFRRVRFTTRPQWLRNVLVRGGYRLIPVKVRRFAYRRLVLRSPGTRAD